MTAPAGSSRPGGQGLPRRGELLERLLRARPEHAAVLATTGFTGRELYAQGDRPNNFYVVGSMGCVASIGLGLALSRPATPVVVLDGDGSVLMRLGSLAAIGRHAPPNLLHIVFDNAAYESTGGQPSHSCAADFCAVAAALGYPASHEVAGPDDFEDRVTRWRDDMRLTFVRARIRQGVADHLPRPKISPPQVAARLRDFLSGRLPGGAPDVNL
jgi:phosphonopyruvate decarboxylase